MVSLLFIISFVIICIGVFLLIWTEGTLQELSLSDVYFDSSRRVIFTVAPTNVFTSQVYFTLPFKQEIIIADGLYCI